MRNVSSFRNTKRKTKKIKFIPHVIQNNQKTSESKRTAQTVREQIELFRCRGAISNAQAASLNEQLHQSCAGQVELVHERLVQLARKWNPYQRNNATNIFLPSTTKTHSFRIKKQLDEEEEKEEVRVNKENISKKDDFYTVLGVPRTASVEEIRRAFHKKALKFHPDKMKNSGNTMTDVMSPSTFSQLSLAYEVLSKADSRKNYDESLKENAFDGVVLSRSANLELEGNEEFKAFEWMARVKDKLDIVDYIPFWTKILFPKVDKANGVKSNDSSDSEVILRFETGHACRGLATNCGKIVSMDEELKRLGSSRRRVYICLSHKYVHACDDSCTNLVDYRNQNSVVRRDERVCEMRANWLAQNWVFDQQQRWKIDEKGEDIKQEDVNTYIDISSGEIVKPTPNILNIQLGSDKAPAFTVDGQKLSTKYCPVFGSKSLKDGEVFSCIHVHLTERVFVCTIHGLPHICTHDQCNCLEEDPESNRFKCRITHHKYGVKSEEVGIQSRKRCLRYKNRFNEDSRLMMEVPVYLPLGEDTSYLLIQNKGCDVKPARKRQKVKGKRKKDSIETSKDSLTPMKSPKHLRILLKVPPAVANIPSVTRELVEYDNINDETSPDKSILIIESLTTQNFVFDLKNYIEILCDGLLNAFDQKIIWDGIVLDEDGSEVGEVATNFPNRMRKKFIDYGIDKKCFLELQIHEECAIARATWDSQLASGKSNMGGIEYNTISISKEAEEDIIEQQEEWEQSIAQEEEAYQNERFQRKRSRLNELGALQNIEVIKYNGRTPKLLGIIPDN